MVLLGEEWRVRQDSNLQPSDLESDALPIRATDPRSPKLARRSTARPWFPYASCGRGSSDRTSLSRIFRSGVSYSYSWCNSVACSCRKPFLSNLSSKHLAHHFEPGRSNLMTRHQFAGRLHSARLKLKAHDGNRTRDLFLTKEVLYRLSYMGIMPNPSWCHRPQRRAVRIFFMERETGFEPATPSLEGSRSTN
jgi:hypothetical protein